MSIPKAQRAIARLRTAEPPERDYYRLLADDRRRTALGVLTEREPPITLEALAEEVAARESDAGGREADPVDRIRVELHHVHLPVLAENDLVEYDWRAGRVEF
jgi:hypothetical protein